MKLYEGHKFIITSIRYFDELLKIVSVSRFNVRQFHGTNLYDIPAYRGKLLLLNTFCFQDTWNQRIGKGSEFKQILQSRYLATMKCCTLRFSEIRYCQALPTEGTYRGKRSINRKLSARSRNKTLPVLVDFRAREK